jgi:D-glycerate 3-kinase
VNIDELLERERLPAEFRNTIEELHVPLAAWIAGELRSRQASLVVGICGAQGSGKSTMALVLKFLLEQQGIVTALLSLDDLYLSKADRQALSERVHPLLETRGVPGTHDVEQGLRVLNELREDGVVALPGFDKSLDERRAREGWTEVHAPVQVVLFEGWCVGAVPQTESMLAQPLNALERESDADGSWRHYVNQRLAGEYQRLFSMIDRLILLQAPCFEVVYRWRLEQEQKLRRRIEMEGGDASGTMSVQQVEKFISHYERITRHILAEMPQRADVVVRLTAERIAEEPPRFN